MYDSEIEVDDRNISDIQTKFMKCILGLVENNDKLLNLKEITSEGNGKTHEGNGGEGKTYFVSVDDIRTEIRQGILTLIECNAKVLRAQDDVSVMLNKLQDLAKKLE